MKKNLITFMVAAAMVMTSAAAFADATDVLLETEELTADGITVLEITPSYIANTVTVTAITEDGISATTNAEDAENPENTINYTIAEDTIVLEYTNSDAKSVEDIKVGDEITVYSNGFAPVPLILPAQYQADVILVDKQEETAPMMFDVDTYVKEDDVLVNVSKTLALNIGEETVIVDKAGEEIAAEELENKDLVVVYGTSTRSIPAQTTPVKVIVLGENELALAQYEASNADAPEVSPEPTDAPEVSPEPTAEPEAFKMPESITVGEKVVTNIYAKEEIVMVPLREIAESLGFKVAWEGETRTVVLNDGMYSLQIDVNSYVKGKMVPAILACAPEITNDLTFVPVEYVTEILEQEVVYNNADAE